MEPELRKMLNRIVYTLSTLIVWLLSNITFGIKFQFAFFKNHFSLGNILFYIWLVVSTVLMLFLIKKIWSKPLNINL